MRRYVSATQKHKLQTIKECIKFKKMKVISKTIIILFVASFVTVGCTATKSNNKAHSVAVKDKPVPLKYKNIKEINKWVEKHDFCEAFSNIEKKPIHQKKVIRCFETAVDELYAKDTFQPPKNILNYLAQKVTLLNIPQGSLTIILNNVVSGQPQNNIAIKKLIEAGASTENIDIQVIFYRGYDGVCNSAITIIKNNKHIYKNTLIVSSGDYAITDLHFLSDAGIGRTMCPKAIKLLASYNKKPLNIQNINGFTPLHYLFTSYANANKDITLAKVLMTKANVNMQSLQGDTPLHHLLQRPNNPNKEFLPLIKAVIKLGGKLTIKNKKGITAKDLILKQPDLIQL